MSHPPREIPTRPPRNRSRILLLALTAGIIGFNALFMSPMLGTPFLGDDSWSESTVRGLLQLTNQSLSELCWELQKDYVRGGRWYPLVVYYYPVFYFLDRGAYRALVFALVLFNILLFGAVIKSITHRASLALLAMLLPSLFIQYRFYHEPILSYYGLMQLETAFILLSLLMFSRYLATQRLLWLWSSVLLYSLNLLVYEAFYFLFIAHILLAFHAWGSLFASRTIKALAPFVAVTALNLLVALIIRSIFAVQYERSQLSVNLGVGGLTFLKQAYAALPLSYALTRGEFWVAPLSTYANPRLLITCGLGVLLFGCLIILLHREGRSQSSSRSLLCVGALGVILWLVPGVLIAASSKYQAELKWGIGYLPVYLSYFGTTSILLAGMAFLAPAVPAHLGARVVSASSAIALFAGVLMVNLVGNENVVAAYKEVELRPRQLLEKALKNNLLDGVPPGSYVICDMPIRAWESPAFLKMHSGITLQLVRAERTSLDEPLCVQNIRELFLARDSPGNPCALDFETGTFSLPLFSGYRIRYDGRQCPLLDLMHSPEYATDSPNVFFLSYSVRSSGQEEAVVGRVRRLRLDGNQIAAVSVRDVRVFVPKGHGPRDLTRGVTGCLLENLSLGPKSTFTIPLGDLRTLHSSGEGIVYGLQEIAETDGIDPRSVHLTESSENISSCAVR